MAETEAFPGNPSFPIRLFISHGRDPEAKRQLLRWLARRRNPPVEPVDLDSYSRSGEPIFATLERIACDCDAAVCLATPDDLGRLVGSKEDSARARQNVWMELGWFWARLGLRRTALLVKGPIEIPSNLQGIFRLPYTIDLAEVNGKFKAFLRTLRELEPDSLTELTYVSSDPLRRDLEWAEVHQTATNHLIVTGVAMGRIRSRLPTILASMHTDKPDLSLDFLMVHPSYVRANSRLFEEQHGRYTLRDNHTFFADLARNLGDFPGVDRRVRVLLYEGFPSFGAVVADGLSWGGTMIAQTFVPKARERGFDYPRFKLRHRSMRGLYPTYWSAIESLINRCTSVLASTSEVAQFASSLPPLESATQ